MTCCSTLKRIATTLPLLAVSLLSVASVRAQDSSQSDHSLTILAALEEATVAAIAKAEKSVVAIARVRRDRQPGDRAQIDPLRIGIPFAFEDPHNDPDFVPSFFGSGVVISEDGFIVTCAHVLDDPRRNDYFVWLNRRSYQARVVAAKPAKVYAADPFSDLAVLKIEAQGLQPISFAKASDVRKGKFVIALGNPDAIARDGMASASWGIVSNLARVAPLGNEQTSAANKDTVHQYGTLIQTDAKLNHGTSGGALVDLHGNMIGLTTSLAPHIGYETSAGFAIASDETFQRVIQSLRSGRLPEYGFLGIQPDDLRIVDRENGLHGARVSVVIPGFPGDRAGLRSEDIIVQVGDSSIRSRNDLFRELSSIAPGVEVQLVVQRFRPGSSRPNTIKLRAELSKKHIATSRPGFAIHGPQKWRGMAVDYTTALAPEQRIGGHFPSRRGSPKVAIFSVDPGTPSWDAGLRPGYGIQSVDGVAIASPTEFQSAIERASGETQIVVVRTDGRIETHAVPESANVE